MATLHAHVTTDTPDGEKVALTVRTLPGEVEVALTDKGFGCAKVVLSVDETIFLINHLTQSLSDIDTQVRLAAEHEEFLQVQARLKAEREMNHAEVYARVTGSVSATYTVEHIDPATGERVIDSVQTYHRKEV